MSTIIVVDDDEMNVGLTKMLLEMEGFEVVTCLDIDEARAAATQAVQGFIIDYHLNHTVTGIDLIQSIRSNEFEANQNAVIIMTSGDYRREKEAVDVGVDLFLLKPYSPAQLTAELHQLLARK